VTLPPPWPFQNSPKFLIAVHKSAEKRKKGGGFVRRERVMSIRFREESEMTIPRKQQISLQHTRLYHCTSRCVRRAFLCGKDRFTGKDFEHRRQWIEDRLVELTSIFAIEILAYAVMHNHYHVVLRVAVEKCARLSDKDVVERWGQLFSVPEDGVNELELREWRCRLASISWFMRCINEPLARRANREDDCTGRFWEGRFKLQALLDDTALLKCMVYVDLNPVRSGLVRVAEDARHTSLRARIDGRDAHLVAFSDKRSSNSERIAIEQREYMNLVRWSAGRVRSRRRSRAPPGCADVLARMHLSHEQWVREIAHYGRWYYRAVGSVTSVERYCSHLGQRWLKGAGRSRVCPA
jgi:REP element-mobilizing transposase RayT